MIATTRLGMLTPSSNTVLEPATAAMLAGQAGVTAHFARFRVTSIGLDAGALAQFDAVPILAAASLLADARPHAICWNGTSGAWLGLDRDRALCAAIATATGVPATTSTLALLDALTALGATRVALVTPYLAAVQAAIVAQLGASGIEVVSERHLDDPGNFSFGTHAEAVVADMARAVGAVRPQAIAIHCTNFRGSFIAASLEAELGVPVLDSVALALWGSLRVAGVATAPFGRHGRLFSLA